MLTTKTGAIIAAQKKNYQAFHKAKARAPF